MTGRDVSELTHIGADGRARMVDVSAKPITARTATASGRVLMSDNAFALAYDNPKGDPVSVAELAGIMGAKHTATLIPLCHPLPVTKASVAITPLDDRSGFHVTAEVKTSGPTGVEMEALTAAMTACLTLYDMLKAADKAMTITTIQLDTKTGGKSGDYRRDKSQ